MRIVIAAASALALFLISGVDAMANKLTPERVFADPDLSGPVAKGVELSPDGQLVTFLRGKPEDQTTLDLWAVATTPGATPMRLVDAKSLAPKGETLSEAEKARRERERISSHGVVEYQWDELGKALLVPVNGALFVADRGSGEVRTLVAKAATGGDAVDGRFSPKGGYVSFVRDATLFAVPVAGGEPRAVTPKAEGAISYATAEFVAQEEMGRFTGYWWSSDERYIAYTRVDESPVDIVPRFDIGASGATVVSQRYPRAGRPNAKVELYIAPFAGGAAVKVDFGADADIYLARANWSADSKAFYVQRESRDQQTLDLLMVDPATGAAKVIVHERQTPWINLSNDFHPLKDGTFLWSSERTGYRHLYLFKRDGELIRQVTHGDWPIGGLGGGVGRGASGLVGVDEAHGLVYFVASKETPLEQHLYVVSYEQPGEPTKITSGEGWWSIAMNKTATAYVAGYSDPKTPPQTGLYDIAGHRLRWIEENRLDASHPYFPYLERHTTPEFGTLKAADGQTLHYALLKPPGFDPTKRYPAIIEVYGGPGVQTVERAWRNPAERLYLEAGFVVFQLDNRGSTNRGLAFEAPIFKHMGQPEVADQIVGLRHLQTLPFIDPKRVGVTGWSYGGYMTLRLLTEPGSGFAAGAAGGPPSDWRLYDTHYTERYMGRPDVDAASYDASAVLPRLGQLSGRLLLMHGMADDNVVFENSTEIMAKLQALGTPFDLMLYPGQRHGVQGQKRKLQQWRTWLAFFERELGAPQPAGSK